MPFLLVFVGSGIGGVLRYSVGVLALRLVGASFPYGTLLINVSGSFVMGLLVEYFLARAAIPQDVRLFMTTGIVGGYTTFSTFVLDVVLLWERGEWLPAVTYVALSVVISIAALVAGMATIRMFAEGQVA